MATAKAKTSRSKKSGPKKGRSPAASKGGTKTTTARKPQKPEMKRYATAQGYANALEKWADQSGTAFDRGKAIAEHEAYMENRRKSLGEEKAKTQPKAKAPAKPEPTMAEVRAVTEEALEIVRTAEAKKRLTEQDTVDVFRVLRRACGRAIKVRDHIKASS